MNILFLGSSHFGEPCLRALIKHGYNISCVVTQPDRKQNRGMHLEPTAVKKAAQELSLPLFQPEDINTSDSVKFIAQFRPDILLVIAYGQRLSRKILAVPKIMPINIHASLLPAYRGAGPINWALINNEKLTGNTLMKVIYAMDAGPVILQKPHPILPEDNFISLEAKLSLEAVDLLLEGLKDIENNTYKLIEQDEKLVTYAPKLTKKDGFIDWNKPAENIYNQVRGCLPWPGAFTYFNKKMLKIYDCKVVSFGSTRDIAGTVLEVSKEGIRVATATADLLIKELQLEGKRRIKARDFIVGYKVNKHDKLG